MSKKIKKMNFIRLPKKELKLNYYKMSNSRCQLKDNLEKIKYSKKILESFFSIPRELFIEDINQEKVYKNVSIKSRNKIHNKPSFICEMIKQLDVKPYHNVLEMGTDTGFTVSIISQMVKKITIIEKNKPLILEAKKIIDILKGRQILRNNIVLIHGDSNRGYNINAPYDRIILALKDNSKVYNSKTYNNKTYSKTYNSKTYSKTYNSKTYNIKLPIDIGGQLKEGGIIIAYSISQKKEIIHKFIKTNGTLINISLGTKKGHYSTKKSTKKGTNINLKTIKKDYTGMVNGRNLNELLSHYQIGITKCNLFNSMKGTITPPTFNSFINIPRELFMPFQYIENTYIDRPHPMAYNQTISQPSLVCKMIDYLDLKPTDKVLEIGTGYGYNSAILSRICKTVVTMDIVIGLVEGAREVYNFLIKKGILRNNIIVLYGDGYKGYTLEQPYNKIIVTCGADKEVPTELLKQLSPNGGICVIPIKNRAALGREAIYRYTKIGENIKEEKLIGVRFVPFKKSSIKTKIII